MTFCNILILKSLETTSSGKKHDRVFWGADLCGIYMGIYVCKNSLHYTHKICIVCYI